MQGLHEILYIYGSITRSLEVSISLCKASVGASKDLKWEDGIIDGIAAPNGRVK